METTPTTTPATTPATTPTTNPTMAASRTSTPAPAGERRPARVLGHVALYYRPGEEVAARLSIIAVILAILLIVISLRPTVQANEPHVTSFSTVLLQEPGTAGSRAESQCAVTVFRPALVLMHCGCCSIAS